MNITFIETFVCIALSKTISEASDRLFISQSTVSYRLNELEKNLDITLVQRGRGEKNILLTTEGKQFLSVALEYLELNKRLKNFKTETNYFALKIGSVESLNIHLLATFYKKLQQDEYDWRISIQNLHSMEIVDLVSAQSIDIGLVVSHSYFPDIVAEELYSEEIVIVFRNKKMFEQEYIDVSQLNREKEIYVDWGSDYDLWRSKYFNDSYINDWRSDSFSIAYQLLGDNYWCFAPQSICYKYTELHYVKLLKIAPFRKIYMIYNSKKHKKNDQVVSIFRGKIINYLKSYALCND